MFLRALLNSADDGEMDSSANRRYRCTYSLIKSIFPRFSRSQQEFSIYFKLYTSKLTLTRNFVQKIQYVKLFCVFGQLQSFKWPYLTCYWSYRSNTMIFSENTSQWMCMQNFSQIEQLFRHVIGFNTIFSKWARSKTEKSIFLGS